MPIVNGRLKVDYHDNPQKHKIDIGLGTRGKKTAKSSEQSATKSDKKTSGEDKRNSVSLHIEETKARDSSRKIERQTKYAQSTIPATTERKRLGRPPKQK